MLIRQFLRTHHRCKTVALNYGRNHQIETRAIGTLHKTQTLPQNAKEKCNLSVNPSDLNRLLEKLKSDADTYKRVNNKTLHSFVSVALKEFLTSSEGVFLLNCCTLLPDTNKQEKTQLIETIWNDGIVRWGQPTKDQIISLLRAYRVVGRTIDDFNAFLAQYECDADVELYEEFLYLTCENGKITDEIVKVLSDIKNRGFPLTEHLFNALILGHSKNSSVENCEKVLETMKSVNLKPTSETFMQLVRAYIENDDFTKAATLMNEQGHTFSQEQIFEVIRTAAVNDSIDMVKKAMELLPEDALLNKRVVPGLRNICIELIHMDKIEMGYNILNNLPKIKFNETEDVDSFGVFFLNELIRHNVQWTKIVDISQRLVKSDRNKRALHCCCEIMLKTNSNNSLDCLKVLNETEPLRPHYFWPLFLSQYHQDGENGILNVLQEMKKLKVSADHDTLVHYVLTKLPITMKETKNAIRILESKGIPIGILLTPVLSNLLHQFKIDEALAVLKLHKVKVDSELFLWPLIVSVRNFTKNSPFATYAELVKTIDARSQKGFSDLAGQILLEIITRDTKPMEASVLVTVIERFHTIGIKIPTTTCDQMLGHVQKYLPIDERKKATALLRKMIEKTLETPAVEQTGIYKHPRDMSLEELECHLIELKSKNLNTRGVLRRLLQVLVRSGKLDRALEINKRCKDMNVEFSPGMLASILDLMIRTKNLTEAEETFSQLKKLYPAFAVDEFKVIDFASLMIENDRIENAREILQIRAKSKLHGGAHCQKNIWALLSNVAVHSAKTGCSTNQTQEFLDFLVKLGYCNYYNTLLGSVIKEHLLKNEIQKAMSEFEVIAKRYRKTPMHFELLTKLIEISNSKEENQTFSSAEAKEMLTKVIGMVASIHGTPNANVSLVVAIAKAGTEAQLRKILIDPKLELNSEMIVKQCEYLSASGNETTLFKLAKCSRGLGRVAIDFKEQDLYNLLLNEYTRENNYFAALALFERMVEDEEIKMSSDFTRNVADLLEKNNLEIPAVLQMHLRKS